jgi:hypothetical protein
MSALEGLRVVASKIHGYGAVATRSFRAGEVVAHGDGVLYRADDDFDDTYALILPGESSGKGDPLFWDLVDQTRWFNHACDPNSEVRSRWDTQNDTMIAWWVALRDIRIGEEITYDYGFAAEVAEPCACGTAACRGVIVDDDPEELAKLSPEMRARLRGPTAALLAAS